MVGQGLRATRHLQIVRGRVRISRGCAWTGERRGNERHTVFLLEIVAAEAVLSENVIDFPQVFIRVFNRGQGTVVQCIRLI